MKEIIYICPRCNLRRSEAFSDNQLSNGAHLNFVHTRPCGGCRRITANWTLADGGQGTNLGRANSTFVQSTGRWVDG